MDVATKSKLRYRGSLWLLKNCYIFSSGPNISHAVYSSQYSVLYYNIPFLYYMESATCSYNNISQKNNTSHSRFFLYTKKILLPNIFYQIFSRWIENRVVIDVQLNIWRHTPPGRDINIVILEDIS